MKTVGRRAKEADTATRSPARLALERLFKRGEQASARDNGKPVRMPMTEAKCPEYCSLQSLDAFERFEAEISLAVRCGAIAAEPEDFGREDRRLERLKLLDIDALGAHLGLPVRNVAVRKAEALLGARCGDHPVLDTVLDQWRVGRRVRGHGPEAASKLADALKAIDERRRDDRHERLLRRESTRIFGDSKRLEALTPWLDLLLTGEIPPSGLEQDQIWSALGLRREPQPVLIAGRGEVLLEEGRVTLCRPYLGLPVDAVRSLRSNARYLMTIENLTSFHDAARSMRDDDGLLIYTGGMPSPPWRAFYARLLRELPDSVRPYHWGDIDEGGFRIAAALAAIAGETGKRLLPWRMSPNDAPEPRDTPSAVTVEKMTAWAERAGWHEIASALRAHPLCAEQESQDPAFPGPET